MLNKVAIKLTFSIKKISVYYRSIDPIVIIPPLYPHDIPIISTVIIIMIPLNPGPSTIPSGKLT
jgi:hypothetical protein